MSQKIFAGKYFWYEETQNFILIPNSLILTFTSIKKKPPIVHHFWHQTNVINNKSGKSSQVSNLECTPAVSLATSELK